MLMAFPQTYTQTAEDATHGDHAGPARTAKGWCTRSARTSVPTRPETLPRATSLSTVSADDLKPLVYDFHGTTSR